MNGARFSVSSMTCCLNLSPQLRKRTQQEQTEQTETKELLRWFRRSEQSSTGFMYRSGKWEVIRFILRCLRYLLFKSDAVFTLNRSRRQVISSGLRTPRPGFCITWV